MSDDYILGGVEGGGTKSVVCLMNTKGEILAEVIGSSTNPWNEELEKCCETVNNLILEAKKKAKLKPNVPLHSLGLCISGFETEDIKKNFVSILRTRYPTLSKNYYAGSDTRAPLAMVHEKGGVVLISGTGSNCLLINQDESEVQCGGFGDRLGDEGSAYWISYRAIKICLDSITNLDPSPNGHSSKKIWETVQSHFKVKSIFDLLPVFYVGFSKTAVASLCLELRKVAKSGDPLALWLFYSSGKYLAKHIQAIYAKADESLRKGAGGLHVVCVGSVWKSWDLIKSGFVDQLHDTTSVTVDKLTLLVITKCPAIGGVYLAARCANVDFTYTFKENYEIFYEFVR